MYSITADRWIIMVSLYGSGEGSRLASIAPI
jgi:hypothetical protein